eukprot:jgi/Galph1/132/GphlegSOOS_G4816.1
MESLISLRDFACQVERDTTPLLIPHNQDNECQMLVQEKLGDKSLVDVTTSVHQFTGSCHIPLNCELLSALERGIVTGTESCKKLSRRSLENTLLATVEQPFAEDNETSYSCGKFQSFCRVAFYNEKLQLQQQVVCSLNVTLEELGSEVNCSNAENSFSYLFCIENVFYTNLELIESSEYIEHVMNFIKEHCKDLGLDIESSDDTLVKSGKDVSLMELQVKFGVPYVFIHLGDCEHKLIFTDLFADIFEEDASKLCKTSFLKLMKPRKCGVCRIRNSSKVCHGHELSDASPCFLCSECYEKSRFDSEGSQVSQVIAEYPVILE